ncbi:hypothetical protein BJP36_31150 [Moorena producens JHB]|uniref:Uncharacterized protein n=1 Tax=Moorena producens (strain JHB) TaxID=1454205 RepID=A0A1D9G7V1_MOOP1|nr:hypothetical protein [Moorena producens]AOY83712.1 hypothetical protein BJP36_31150 [Moorena producens JHB]
MKIALSPESPFLISHRLNHKSVASTPERQSNLDIETMVNQMITRGQLSRQEYLQLTSAFLCDYNISDAERHQINRIFDNVQTGRVKLVDYQVS